MARAAWQQGVLLCHHTRRAVRSRRTPEAESASGTAGIVRYLSNHREGLSQSVYLASALVRPAFVATASMSCALFMPPLIFEEFFASRSLNCTFFLLVFGFFGMALITFLLII